MSATEDRIRRQEAARAARREVATNTPTDAATATEAAKDHRSRKAPVVRTTRVRKTVDLPPARYAAFDRWCAETAVAIGVTRVTGQVAINALIHRLLTDETMARRIRADIADELT
jgi:hypothetical protein